MRTDDGELGEVLAFDVTGHGAIAFS